MPPPPEGTPERREWEERYAHVLHPPRPSQQKEVEEQDTGPPREGMSLAEWKQYDNEPLARYERQQANQAFSATPSRLEARGGYTLNDLIRQRLAAQRAGRPASRVSIPLSVLSVPAPVACSDPPGGDLPECPHCPGPAF